MYDNFFNVTIINLTLLLTLLIFFFQLLKAKLNILQNYAVAITLLILFHKQFSFAFLFSVDLSNFILTDSAF